jgi:hypothetical protein
MNIFKRFVCRHILGHRFDETHGYNELPYDGSKCVRCGLVAVVQSS